MENLTHSLSKKSYSGNGFGMATATTATMTRHHKSVYDDVFGGAPKFGVPTLAPRFEDYNEIFGGFHSSRGSSVPILDLPVVEEVELPFDVPNSRLDYFEVFGGYEGLDFALSFDDLSRKSNGLDDSSDDAWSPAQSECPTDETDPSICSERSENLLNATDNPLFDDVRQFNVLYHKVSQKPSEMVSNKDAHIAQVHAIPGHAYLMNDTHPSPVIEDMGPEMLSSSDHKSNTELLGRKAKERCFNKSISLPAKHGSKAPGSDPHIVGSSTSTFTGKKPFVTVNDISLRTRPSRLPPPSRPPPIFSVEKGEPQKPNSNLQTSKTFAFEQMSGKTSPPFYDVEIDASSSKVAPVAQEIEKGQAKIRSSEEEMEKNTVLPSHSNLQAQETNRIVEKLDKPSDGDNICEGDTVQGLFARCGKGMDPNIHEEQNGIRISQVASDLLDDEKYIDLVEKPTNRRHDEEFSSQSSHMPEGIFAWRQETEYFEVVEADMSMGIHEQDRAYKSNVLQNKEGCEDHRRYVKESSKASQLQEVIKEVKASKETPKSEEGNIQLEMWEDAHELSKNETRLNKPKENTKNVKVDVSSYTSEATKKKIKRPKHYPKMNSDKNVEMLATAEHEVPEVEVKYNSNGVCDMTDSYEVIINIDAKRAVERIPMYCNETKECGKNLEEAVEEVDDVKCKIHQEEEMKRGPRDKEENWKNEKETCQGKSSGGIVKETTEQEEYDQKLNLKVGYDESENDFKKAYGQEDKERHREPEFEIDEKKETVVETCMILENEWYEVACATGELSTGPTVFWKQELGKHGATVAFEDEDTGVKSSLTSALKGSTGTGHSVTEHEESAEQTEDLDQVKWDEDEVANFYQDIHDPAKVETTCSFNGMFNLSNKVCETLETETAQATISQGEDKKLETKFEDYEQDISTPEIFIEEISISSDKNHGDLQHRNDNVHSEHNTTLPSSGEFLENSEGANNGIGNSASTQDKKTAQVTSDPERIRANTHEHRNDNVHSEHNTTLPSSGEFVKNSDGANNGIGNSASTQDKKAAQVASDPERIRANTHGTGQKMNFSEESAKEKPTMHQVFTEWTENDKKIGAGLFTVPDFKDTLNMHQRAPNEDKQRQNNVALPRENRKIEERLHQEKKHEKEQLRKLEEEREREREREKDRMAVNRASLEVRERLYAEARDRAERNSFGRSTTEIRQRAAVEARGRLDKESMEARLRAERAAVERATAEARQRAFEKAVADKASFESREKVGRPVTDRFYGSSGNAEMRQSSSFWQDLPDLQSRSAGTSNVMRTTYSTTNGGVESESPQRSKARLERYRRTAERAAKALAEKNMRDFLAQREQAERSRLAENLDAEVRRWSSGKEGNLRALLSTLQYILGQDSGWQPIPLTEVITSAAVKKAYRKATLCVHPDKLQQRGASIQQKYVCEKVFDLLKEAWNTFNSAER